MRATSVHPAYASIDIGSHTIRLLIASMQDDHTILPLRTERRITRLARDFQNGEVLSAPRMLESIAVLQEYEEILKQYDVCSVACGATGVVRRARNQEEFLRDVFTETGLRVSILSEASEARLSGKGIISVLPDRQGLLLSFDLGGGSTEFLLADVVQPEPIWDISVSIGAATVTERFLTDDPPPAESVGLASAAVRDTLKEALLKAKALLRTDDRPTSPFQLVGTAGTVTTLAAMKLKMTRYEPFRVNGLVLTEAWLTDSINHLARSSLASRRSIPGLEKGREDIILGGALIVREIMRELEQDRLTVTDAGLLEGLLLSLIEMEYGRHHAHVSPLTWELQKE